MRLIDADAFRKILVDRQITTQFFHLAERNEIGCIIDILDYTPTIDSESLRPTGEWIHIDQDWHELWQCSNCKEEWDFAYDPTEEETIVKYCPDCGARMKGAG